MNEKALPRSTALVAHLYGYARKSSFEEFLRANATPQQLEDLKLRPNAKNYSPRQLQLITLILGNPL